MSDGVERSHAWTHLVLFLMLFMVALAVMRFSTPTGLAAGNHSITSNGPGDLKPFLTAVGLLMTMLIVALIVVGANIYGAQPKMAVNREIEAPRKRAVENPERQAKSLEDINRDLARIRKSLGR
jgi:hypothetical protein